MKLENNNSILIVDDNMQNLQILGRNLKSAGYNVEFATNAQIVFNWINDEIFDLILLDVMMPDVNGFELCRKIKENDNYKEIPIIFITARNDSESIKNAYNAGGVDYITKPFNNDELLARVRTHLEIHKQKKELIELNTTKDRLFSIISHDLRTPVYSISLLLNRMVLSFEKIDREFIFESLNDLNAAARNVHDLLDSVLTWAKSQMGMISFMPKKMNVFLSLNESVNYIQNLIKDKNLTVYIKCPQSVSINTDPYMLDTIVRNFLTNAIKFSVVGGEIVIKYVSKGGKHVISVTDKGIGMKDDELNRLLSFRENITRLGTNNEVGAGLGLLICREFAAKMNGNITLSSKLGDGTTASFVLPIV